MNIAIAIVFLTLSLYTGSGDSGTQESWKGLRNSKKKSEEALNRASACVQQPQARAQDATEEGETFAEDTESSEQGQPDLFNHQPLGKPQECPYCRSWHQSFHILINLIILCGSAQTRKHYGLVAL